MKNRSHTNNDDSGKIDVSVYTQKINHLEYMLEITKDIAQSQAVPSKLSMT